MKQVNSRVDSSIILLTVVIALAVAGVAFLASNIVSADNQAQGIMSDIRTEYVKREHYTELQAIYQKVLSEGITDKLSTLLPSAQNFLAVVAELEQISKASGNSLTMRLGEARLSSDGVEVGSVTGRAPTLNVQRGGNNFDYVEIEATLRGNFDNLNKFLSLFHQAKYFMNINSMSVNRIEVEGNRYVDTQLVIRLYVQKLVRTT